MAFITDNQLTVALADILRVDTGILPAAWGRVVTDSNSAAYLDVRGALIQRGFLASQVDAWDRGAEFNRDIGLFWCLVKGAGLHQYDDKFIKLLDRRKELESVLVELGGTPQTPAGEPPAVGYGSLDLSEDRFNKETTW